jgi:hypothetical protein
MEDRLYRDFLIRIMEEERGKVLTVAAFERVASDVMWEDMGWFFQEWLRDGVVPLYRIDEAQVILSQNLETRDFEYTTSVMLRNDGDGNAPVPIRLLTEADGIDRRVILGPNEKKTIVFVTRDRPLLIQVDPEGWVVQQPEFDERAKRPLHPQLALKTVKEL